MSQPRRRRLQREQKKKKSGTATISFKILLGGESCSNPESEDGKPRITGGRALLRSDGEQAVDVSLGGAPSHRRHRPRRARCGPRRARVIGRGRPSISTGAGFNGTGAETPAGLSTSRCTTPRHSWLAADDHRRGACSWSRAAGAGAWASANARPEARRWTCDMRVHLRWEAYSLSRRSISRWPTSRPTCTCWRSTITRGQSR